MIFMGILFGKEDEKTIFANLKHGVSNAANLFQWNVIEGLCENEKKVSIINSLGVGTWPKSYKKLFLESKAWKYNDMPCYEIGGINLPFIKQLMRGVKAKRILKKLIKEDSEILIYSAYMPYLKAVYKLPRSIKVCAIITDLPEYYDLANCSKPRKFLRNLQNRLIYKYMKRVDRFVILTEQMKAPLQTGKRPYTVVEGICPSTYTSVLQNASDNKIVFYSGTLNYRYGIKNLLDAFSQIEDEEAQLWICGSGEAADEIKKTSETDHRIRYFGFLPLEKVAELRSQASVLVNPRTNEGEYTKYSFPSKTMEYMASGIPLVMYKLDGIPDEYDDYITYVENNSAQSLKNALVKVLEMSEDDRNCFAQKARDFVVNEKSKKTQAEKIIKLFED